MFLVKCFVGFPALLSKISLHWPQDLVYCVLGYSLQPGANRCLLADRKFGCFTFGCPSPGPSNPMVTIFLFTGTRGSQAKTFTNGSHDFHDCILGCPDANCILKIWRFLVMWKFINFCWMDLICHCVKVLVIVSEKGEWRVNGFFWFNRMDAAGETWENLHFFGGWTILY